MRFGMSSIRTTVNIVLIISAVLLCWQANPVCAADRGHRVVPVELGLMQVQHEFERLAVAGEASTDETSLRLAELEADLDRLQSRLRRSPDRKALSERLAGLRAAVVRARSGFRESAAKVNIGSAKRVGSISGTVLDHTGAPLGEQTVVYLYPAGDYWNYEYVNSDYTTGAYQFTDVADGTYFLRAGWNDRPYVVEVYADIPCPNSYCWAEDGTSVNVAGDAVTGIDFWLEEAGSVKGMVLSPQGWDLSDARVALYDLESRYEDGVVWEGWTNYDGDNEVYEARGLPTGCYFAVGEPRRDDDDNYGPGAYPDVQLAWMGDAPRVGQPISVVAGAQTTGIDIQLSGGAVIVAQATDGFGEPVANSGAVILVKTLSGRWVEAWEGGDLKRDASGIFIADRLGAGEYVMSVYAYPEFLKRSVVGATELAPGAKRNPDHANLVGEIWDNIPCPSRACLAEDGTIIDVASSSLNVLDFQLEAGGWIRGSVTETGSGLPLENIELQATAPGLSTWTEWTETWSGSYTIYGLPAGAYTVRAVGLPQEWTWEEPGYVTEMFDDVPCVGLYCDTSVATAVAVAAGAETSGIDFVLDLEGSITGSVNSGSENPPLSGVTVRAWTPGGQDAEIEDVTDYQGAFELRGLNTGDFFVTADTLGGGLEEVGELYDDIPCPAGDCDVVSGTPVGVTAGAPTENISFSLPQGGAIEGAVTAGGMGVPGVLVTVTDGAGIVFGSATTGCDGSYRVAGLVTGTYFAYTTNHRGYADFLFNQVWCSGQCIPEDGEAIAVTIGMTTSGIDFPLDAFIFGDGFESGDTSAWSN